MPKLIVHGIDIIDTQFSEGLNPGNIALVDKINIGMSKTEVISILGEPLYITKLYGNQEWYRYTNDGAAPFDWDFSWLEVRITFENDILIEKKIDWIHD
jgi:outer membrane protein assembly factor BamE (lipoprotein component of BamABCDE complex)